MVLLMHREGCVASDGSGIAIPYRGATRDTDLVYANWVRMMRHCSI